MTVRAEAYELGGELDAEIQFLDGRRMVVQVRMGDSGGVVRFEHEQANGSYSDYQLEHRCESIYGLTDEELMTLEETERYLLVDWYREATDTPYLAARDRRAVYVSLEDDLHKSHCEEDCLAEWQPMEPPYLYCPVDLTHFFLQEVLVGPVTYFTRPDGTVQVALNGKPLYQYSGDSETGELQGCGLDEAWFPINADTGLPVIGC